jgi:hypothetical protein
MRLNLIAASERKLYRGENFAASCAKKGEQKSKKSNITHNTLSLELYFHMKAQRRDLNKKNKRFHYLHVPMILDLVGTVGSAVSYSAPTVE